RVLMRTLAVLACLGFSMLSLTGCTSSGIDSLGLSNLKPSNETTSAIQRPSAKVAASATTEAGMPTLTPNALVGETGGKAAEVVALAVPGKSAARKAVVRHRFRDAKPIDFGKVAPQHYPVHGVDVSRWQGDIDWNTLR